MAMKQISLTVTLSDGSEHVFTISRMPRHWKSWVMQQMPYGTDFYGCKWGVSR